MKKAVILLFILFGFFSLEAQKTEIQYLSGLDKDNMVQWDFMVNNGMNKDKWSKIGVPSNWELQGFGSYLYGNVNKSINETGLYKYEFRVSKTWKKKKVFIVFEGSMTDTEVKINGKLAGPIHQGSFYQFKYDISELLKWEDSNTLEVKVTKESANESVNRAERISDYWVFGGIFRQVYLKAVPARFIDRVAIDAKADGSFYMDVYTRGIGKANTVTAQLQTPDGKLFGGTISSIVNNDSTGKAVIRGTFTDPALWNPEFPNLYQVVVSLSTGNKVVHQMSQKFGFRTVEVRPEDGIYVNNQKIIFRGVCRHTFWPTSGRTSSKKLAIDDVNLMKDMNMNAVRMSHYPPDQYFLDVCDSLGLFVLDELAGWQKFYDTPTAKRLVKQFVERDVNHPSIVLWDNGNEGGFNKDVRLDYSLYDPQKRTVIEPWSIINGTNTKHYPKFAYVKNALNTGKEIFFPTEFLHGLNDGGLGAGLDDQWNFMLSKPLSAGAFLWVFADEGVERKDKNDSIDTWGNRAPDGILGPYHEKEGSFYTVKEIWSPVNFETTEITPDFNGKLEVNNRFLYSNLNLSKYSFELVKFGSNFPKVDAVRKAGTIKPPDIAVGEHGTLNLDLPGDWKSYDVLYVTAVDQYGRHINTWSWKIMKPQDFSSRVVNSTLMSPVTASDYDNQLTVTSGKTAITFDKLSGSITSVKSDGRSIPFGGLKFAGFNRTFKEMKNYPQGDNYVIEILYDSSCYAIWSMMKEGWLKLDYGYSVRGSLDYAGITFTYPENLVTGATLMANGPYRVWKNRLKGTQFGVFEKKYNNTVTGQSWNYPEFKGYYSNFYAVQVQTKEIPFTILSATDDLFLHLFTPATATNLKGVNGSLDPPFPSGNISVLHGISPVGTKFSSAREEGPQGGKNSYNNEVFRGLIYFRFGVEEACPTTKNLDQIVENALDKSVLCLKKSVSEVGDRSKYPSYATKELKWKLKSSDDWTSGFYPGTLWYAYELTKDDSLRKWALEWTAGIENEKLNSNTHDLGFRFNCSFGNGLRLLPKDAATKRYKEILLTAAATADSRFSSIAGLYPSSWDANPLPNSIPAVVDVMMNLELLLWASENGGDPKIKERCITHASTTYRDFVREDGGTFHVVRYDKTTGKILSKGQLQGDTDSSTWSRGQAWMIYGFTVMYRYTKNSEYLEKAMKLADYFTAHLPADRIANWDFQSELKFPDASASAIVTSALFELQGYIKDTAKKKHYLNELKDTVYALDSTTIDLCLSLFPWAHFRSTKAAVKMHTLLDLRGNIPSFIHVSDGKMHDVHALDMILPEAGAIYVMDRGYVDFARLYGLHQAGAFFVTRAKSNLNAHRVYSAAVDRTTGVIADQTITLDGHYTSKDYPMHLRRVRFRDPKTGKTLVFLTNRTALPALTICDLYKSRWQVELFFKWIKQHLRIKQFYGTSENAVKTQIWIAVSVYVLAAIVRKRLKLDVSLYTLMQVFSVTVFEKASIESVIFQTTNGSAYVMDDNQLNLFGY